MAAILGFALIVLFCALVIIAVRAFATNRRVLSTPEYPRMAHAELPQMPRGGQHFSLIESRHHLLSPAEQAFYSVLDPLVRHACVVSAKVRLADLLDVLPVSGQRPDMNWIAGKHVDFVIADTMTGRILCAIALDDSSHPSHGPSSSDSFMHELFASWNLPLLRIPCAWTYFPKALRAELLKTGLTL